MFLYTQTDLSPLVVALQIALLQGAYLPLPCTENRTKTPDNWSHQPLKKDERTILI